MDGVTQTRWDNRKSQNLFLHRHRLDNIEWKACMRTPETSLEIILPETISSQKQPHWTDFISTTSAFTVMMNPLRFFYLQSSLYLMSCFLKFLFLIEGRSHKFSTYFSAEMFQARREWNIFKMLKEKHCQTKTSGKMVLQKWRRNKMFSDKQKLRGFIITQAYLYKNC